MEKMCIRDSYNSGTINVEKGTVNGPNDKAIGIYGTNNTNIVNDGAVNVGGNKSIGILGLSYRIDQDVYKRQILDCLKERT